MAWKCKHGDLAIIINETPQCRANIGLIVEVRGPMQYIDFLNLQGWRVKPIQHKKVWVETLKNNIAELQTIYWKYPRRIPDAWLLPIRPTDDDIDISDAQEVLNSITSKGYIESPKCNTQKTQATKLEI
jgi:hypothetical protein